ncbi:MAG: division/cell wall cluster transcriptional repressor MraZ [Oligoflexia bacterium]|nr:division/cell wall cluster transcriptional repressor MraZ [Oligoflexia bacterium]
MSTSQFRGRFELKADSKFRLSLPSEFREIIHSLKDSKLVITNSQYQGRRCLDVYPNFQWKKLENKIARLPQLKIEVQNFQRFYLSGGHNVELDNQGRVLIPASLRTYADIKSEVVVVGFSNKFEIWSKETWTGLFDNLANDFTQTLSQISELDGSDND